jgi:hypothetical protein
MSHFLFCIKEYTNKQGDFCRPFIVDLSTYRHSVVLCTIYNDVWRHLSASLLAPLNGVSLASLNDVHFGDTRSSILRRNLSTKDVTYDVLMAPLNGVQYTIYNDV